MGSLSKVWLRLENAKKSDASSLILDGTISLVGQSIRLLGQISNLILYR